MANDKRRDFIRSSSWSTLEDQIMQIRWFVFLILSVGFLSNNSYAQDSQQKKKKEVPTFQWVNEPTSSLVKNYPHFRHESFRSPSLEEEVGYCIYLPPQYEQPEFEKARFPVVYYLHGGRPGNELKSVRLTNLIHEQIQELDVPPMIHVFVNIS